MKVIKKYFPLSLKDFFLFLAAMGVGSLLCLALQRITTSDVHVPLIFVLVVLIISLLTDGYFWGSLAALSSVFAVNWAFTYPYMKLDFSIYGYPLTFITMLAVGIATSTLATRLKEQEKLKLETEKEKTRANLLRSVSHDLRTPLTGISGSVSAILDSGESMSDSEKRELLENVRKDADWLYTMVENLLSITRISGEGSGEICKTDELLEEVVSEAVLKFRNHNRGIHVDVSIPDEMLFVPMDAMLVEQLLINLMDNSVIHGNTTDRINVRITSDNRNAYISVADNGTGIDKKLLPHLFDGSLQYGGHNSGDSNRFMGIGLTVCKTIADAHGGAISARNIDGSGAEFTLSLPLSQIN